MWHQLPMLPGWWVSRGGDAVTAAVGSMHGLFPFLISFVWHSSFQKTKKGISETASAPAGENLLKKEVFFFLSDYKSKRA